MCLFLLFSSHFLFSFFFYLCKKALGFGPNGGLVYCMEFLMSNLELLEDTLGVYEDEYLLFDCPGMIET
jgi:hypothetical protein